MAGVLLTAGWLLWAAPAAAAAGGCRPETPAVAGMARHDLRLAGEVLRVRVADEPAEWRAGFQHLCPGAGGPILFVFPVPQRMGFHMRNVHQPLDIAFLGEDGRVLAVARMAPGRGRSLAPVPVRYVLEAPAGWLAARGLRPGGPALEGLP